MKEIEEGRERKLICFHVEKVAKMAPTIRGFGNLFPLDMIKLFAFEFFQIFRIYYRERSKKMDAPPIK